MAEALAGARGLAPGAGAGDRVAHAREVRRGGRGDRRDRPSGLPSGRHPPGDAPRDQAMKSFVAISLGLAAGIFLFPAALGLTDSMPAAAATAVLGAVAFGFWMHRRPIVPLDETAALDRSRFSRASRRFSRSSCSAGSPS